MQEKIAYDTEQLHQLHRQMLEIRMENKGHCSSRVLRLISSRSGRNPALATVAYYNLLAPETRRTCPTTGFIERIRGKVALHVAATPVAIASGLTAWQWQLKPKNRSIL
jgi:hypothetical protein